ncbi:MAG: hypothetical protein HW390_2359 [Candidatus Brocadiaceae bacterium]|nr:hypothetical protein [Candidatus Brocadiaceae bacterium]
MSSSITLKLSDKLEKELNARIYVARRRSFSSFYRLLCVLCALCEKRIFSDK